MMLNAKSVVTRVEFRTNATQSDCIRIPLGFVVESLWDDMRWMGMIYRPKLTSNELKEINLDTWPELRSPEALLHDMFESAWLSQDGDGGRALASHFGPFSALHAFVEDDESNFAVALEDPSDPQTASVLIERLQKFEPQLKPAFSATILSFIRANPKLKSFNAPRPNEQVQLAAG
jgi:hypothetical protein